MKYDNLKDFCEVISQQVDPNNGDNYILSKKKEKLLLAVSGFIDVSKCYSCAKNIENDQNFKNLMPKFAAILETLK